MSVSGTTLATIFIVHALRLFVCTAAIVLGAGTMGAIGLCVTPAISRPLGLRWAKSGIAADAVFASAGAFGAVVIAPSHWLLAVCTVGVVSVQRILIFRFVDNRLALLSAFVLPLVLVVLS